MITRKRTSGGKGRGRRPRSLPALWSAVSEPANPLLWGTGCVLAFWMRVFTRRHWSHQERVPRDGGVIVVANHISNVDPIALSHFLVYAGRWPRFLAKASLFGVPLLGPLLRRCGQIPVQRGSREAASSLSAAVTALQQGRCVVVYPEGTITTDPALWPMAAKTGAARLALAAGVPVIPVAQWGAQEILYGKHLGLPRLLPRKTMNVTAGAPVRLDDLRAQPVSAEVLQAATGRIMARLTDLLTELRGEPPPALRFGRFDTGQAEQ